MAFSREQIQKLSEAITAEAVDRSEATPAALSAAVVRGWFVAQFTQTQRADIGDIMRVLMQNGVVTEVKSKIGALANLSTKSAAAEMVDIFEQNQFHDVDTTHPRFIAGMQLLVADNEIATMTDAVRVQVMATATTDTIEGWQKHGLPGRPSLNDVEQAQALL